MKVRKNQRIFFNNLEDVKLQKNSLSGFDSDLKIMIY